MGFEQPWWLAALVAVPAVGLAWRLTARMRVRSAIAFTNLELLASLPARRSWRRRAATAALLLALGAAAVAVARPYVVRPALAARGSLILVVDTSGSMSATDVRPTRLAAAKAAVRSFLGHVPGRLRVGLVALGTEPQVVLPPTGEHRLVADAVERLVPGGGTAIGDALVAAVGLGERAQPGARSLRLAAAHGRGELPGRGVSILLLSDGSQTDGSVSPLAGAERARRDGVRVDTISLGTPDGELVLGTAGAVPVPPDPATLARIARITGGVFADATSNAVLREAYMHVSARLGRPAGRSEIGFGFLAAAAGLLTAGLAAGMLATRLP